MTAYSMPLREEFVQHLDQIVLAGVAGKEVLTDMIAKATQGENPAPPGNMDRPPTQLEIAEATNRLATAKAATDKANATNARLEAEKRDADAKKAAEEVAATNAHLDDQLLLEENDLLQARRNTAANLA